MSTDILFTKVRIRFKMVRTIKSKSSGTNFYRPICTVFKKKESRHYKYTASNAKAAAQFAVASLCFKDKAQL